MAIPVFLAEFRGLAYVVRELSGIVRVYGYSCYGLIFRSVVVRAYSTDRGLGTLTFRVLRVLREIESFAYSPDTAIMRSRLL